MDVADEGTLMTAADQYLAPDFKEITEINEQSKKNDVIEWSRDHRCHHKWTDTDADPHNTKRHWLSPYERFYFCRGFFFSHMGWLLVRKHPQLKQKGAQIYMGDLYEDSILMFQRRYSLSSFILFIFLGQIRGRLIKLKTNVNETLFFSHSFSSLILFLSMEGDRALWCLSPRFMLAEELYPQIINDDSYLRYCFILHETWLINSAAHKYGFKPYDINITPTESFWLAVVAAGEGGHNYHHVFPQDYRTSEYSFVHNITKVIIDAMAAVGLVYDLKVVPQHVRREGKNKDNGKEMAGDVQIYELFRLQPQCGNLMGVHVRLMVVARRKLVLRRLIMLIFAFFIMLA
uniref:Fatty acid desaturase domain-containing protein n=1 Tax=Parascaris equorum TaxID=6256 RepID=A0A914RNL6_PAREQ